MPSGSFPNFVACLLALIVVGAGNLNLRAEGGAASDDNGPAEFARQVVPLLRERCFRCHEGRDCSSGVRLDLRAELLGETGGSPRIVPGDAAGSRLIQAVRHPDPAQRMPPEGAALTAEQTALLARWIDAGAAWDAAVLPERESPREHWAFQPIRRPPIPELENDGWSRTLVDRFVAAEHRRRRLSPSPPADRRTLIRRLYFDLWGLPPSWDEVQAFAADESPDAEERLIERLLADPRYGQRWGRHWLDVARWAESEGFESNHPRPFAWRYRDYVVQAFNEDRPFDRFLTQQLAGDELPEYSDEHLIATGFLAAARVSSNEEDKWLQRNDVTVDVVNAVGSAFLGLTLHCAQCHDHKFDPLSARDYYALHAFFARGLPLNVRLQDADVLRQYEQVRRSEYEQALALKQTLFEQARRRAEAEIRAQLSEAELRVYDRPPRERTPDEELQARRLSLKFQKTPGGIEKYILPADRRLYDELSKRIREWEAETPPFPQTFAFYAPATSPHTLQVLPSIGFYPLPYDPVELANLRTTVLYRGDVHQIGADVEPGFPAVLSEASLSKESDGAGPLTRRDLASWLTHPDHPLTARVWANRVWQFHFGRGLTSTSDDFGLRGARPSHPELLDTLAAELIEHGWSTKRLHRLILNSATYRQSAAAGPAATSTSRAQDAENRWLARWAPRRLEAEAIRDAWLATSGELDDTAGGPSVPVDKREASRRRSLYLFQRRGQAPEMQRLFDGPQECAASVAARDASTTPLQSLYLLNSEFAQQRSAALAERVRASARSTGDGANREALVTAAFRQTLLRDPRSDERAAAEEFWRLPEALSADGASPADGAADPLALLCQALLNLNEFAFLE